MKLNSWQTLSTKQIYTNPWLSVREDQVIRPDGSQGIYGVVEGRPFVCIIPLMGDEVCLTEQFRYPIGKRSLEFPAGGIEEGESIEAAMHRELQEELGLVAGSFEKIGFLYEANGHCTVGFHIFVAKDCHETERKPESTEADMTVMKMPMTKLKELVVDGTITDGPTVAALGVYLLT